jgi:hypothetical protein
VTELQGYVDKFSVAITNKNDQSTKIYPAGTSTAIISKLRPNTVYTFVMTTFVTGGGNIKSAPVKADTKDGGKSCSTSFNKLCLLEVLKTKYISQCRYTIQFQCQQLSMSNTLTKTNFQFRKRGSSLKPHCIRCSHFKVDDVSALEPSSKLSVRIVEDNITALLHQQRMPWMPGCRDDVMWIC